MSRLARTFFTACALVLLASISLPASALELKETHYFAHSVASGAMPPVRKRVPETPLIYRPDGKRYTLGRQGGSLRILMARPKDTRLMVVYGYARLVKYNEKYVIVARTKWPPPCCSRRRATPTPRRCWARCPTPILTTSSILTL